MALNDDPSFLVSTSWCRVPSQIAWGWSVLRQTEKWLYVTSNIKLLKTTASIFCALLWITSCHVIGYYLCRRSYREELRLRPIKWEEQRAAGNFVSLEAHPSCSQGLNAWSSSWQLDCHLTRNFKPESWAKFSCIPNCQTVRQWLCVMPKFWNTCYAATDD